MGYSECFRGFFAFSKLEHNDVCVSDICLASILCCQAPFENSLPNSFDGLTKRILM